MASETLLGFHGAGRTVTGSCMLLQHGPTRILIDCGLFQGSKSLQELNYRPFGFDPRSVHAVILTHAHIDHCGLLPKLCAEGFNGPIYCTEPTQGLLRFSLPDAGHIQESEAERLSERNSRRGLPPVKPVYTQDDAERAVEQARLIDLGQWLDLGPGLKARLWNAGHILGSASVEVVSDDLSILFSGDLGPNHKAFHPDPEAPSGLDYVITESTYGNRDRPDVTLEQRRNLLEKEVEAALAAGGNLLIPTFAIERTQELLLDLAQLMNSGRLARTQVFVDSPLASRATGVFDQHYQDLEDMPADGGSPFRHPAFHFVQSGQHSRQLANLSGVIILAASGMCEAGRIRHHLKNNLWDRRATVLFVGYQAEGTLGRAILDGSRRVRIHGEEVAVNARIRELGTYSAHADCHELTDWMRARLPVHGGVFLTHGEPPAMDALTDRIAGLGIGRNRIIQPEIGAVYALRKGEAPALRTKGTAAVTPGRDWHNDYASLMVDLKAELNRLPGDAARADALKRMREVLAGYR